MPVITSNIYAGGATPAHTIAANVALTIEKQAGIFSVGSGSGAHGLVATNNNEFDIFGSIFSHGASAIRSANGSHDISIGVSGSLYGYETGVYLSAGGNKIINAGSISSAVGLGIEILGAGGNTVENSGTIRSAAGVGINLAGANNTFFNSNGFVEVSTNNNAVQINGTVDNYGRISGGAGVVFQTSAGSLLNAGEIIAKNMAGYAVVGTGFADGVTNTGTIQAIGTVAIGFGGGNDTYLGANGLVIGGVYGEAGDDTMVGGVNVDIFRGGGDNDTLTGGGGADTLDGGSGNDHYRLNADASNDTILDASGIDAVHSTITRSIGTWAVIENLILEGAANINGTGNAGGNSIVGNGGNNVLAGLGGNDVLVGGGGNDQLFGQADKDNLTGGAANDRFIIQAVAHTAKGMGDVIVDLDDNGDDQIDLTGIIPGALTFMGQGAFTGANQVRYQQVGANVLVEINTAGNSVAEGEITLLNTTIGNAAVGQVNAADFLL